MNQQTRNKQQLKKKNARVEKWRYMIHNGVLKNPSLLQIRVRKGIPSSIRMLAWPEIVELQKFKQQSPYSYSKLINQLSNSIYDIALDIRRTFPQQQQTKILAKSMNNVLKSISIVYPKIGYCQGMNFLIFRMLEILNDQTAFWLLHYCLEQDQNIRNLFIDPSSITKQTFVLEKLVNQYLPDVGNKFYEQLLNLVPFTLKWFIPLCSSIFEQQLFYRVFEIYLIEGWTTFYAVGLALLKLHENLILDNRVQQNCTLLSKKLRVVNINEFIELMGSFGLERSKIGKIQAQFTETDDKFTEKRKILISQRQEKNKNFKGYTPRSQEIVELNIQNQMQIWKNSGLQHLRLRQ